MKVTQTNPFRSRYSCSPITTRGSGGPMSLARVTTWTFLLACGFALLSYSDAQAQNPLPKKPDVANNINKYRETIRGGIPPNELGAARKDFKAFAQYYADVIAHPAVWQASLEPKVDNTKSPIPTIDSGP